MNDRHHEAIALSALPRASAFRYRPGATLFASPSRVLLADGVKARLAPCPAGEVPAQARRLLRQGAPGDLLIGALPFDPAGRSRLLIPRQLRRAAPGSASGAVAMSTRSVNGVTMRPTPEVYRANVERALSHIQAAGLEKVVLSRSVSLRMRIDLSLLLQRLAAANPQGYTFAVDVGEEHAPRTLVGASPELLLKRQGLQVHSHPLAGSIARSADPEEDRRRAAGLLASSKDLHEHAVVVDAVATALRPWCRSLQVPATPSLLSTPSMWHLGTRVTGELLDPSVDSLTLASALHPTPAVCGHPSAAARAFIAAREGFDRGYFAGLVGWCDAAGDGEWAVTLRCAEVGADEVTLYAGAGVVAGSDPLRELQETSAKLRTMLGAMGVESLLEDAA
jgi:isochorismate synthase